MFTRILRHTFEWVTLALALVLVGCGLAEQAKDKAQEVGDKASDKGKALGDRAKGEISDAAEGIFARGADVSDDSVEAILARGKQLAPVAFSVAESLDKIVDTDTKIEPIVQKLDDDSAQAELDARIKDMPRVETIDGVDVGFRDVTQWDTAGRETESAYLILWRHDDTLLGLIYRSKHRINVDKLVEEAPRLISIVSGVL